MKYNRIQLDRRFQAGQMPVEQIIVRQQTSMALVLLVAGIGLIIGLLV